VPTPLLLLLVVCVVEALAWCIVLPPLQGPDEVTHVAYVQRMVEAREIPWTLHANPADPRGSFSTELTAAAVETGIQPLYANVSARPAGTELDEAIWAKREASMGRNDRNNGGFTSALRNPPAYYLYEGVTYLATSPLGIFDQIFVMRLANIPFLLLTVTFVWLSVGEVLGRRRWLQTVATGAVALQPQLIHLTATINPDIMLSAVWSAGLYLMIVILGRGLTIRRTAALVALCVVAGFTHARGVALAVPALLTLVFGYYKLRRPGARPTRRLALAFAGVGTILVVPLFVYLSLGGDVTTSRVRQFGSYLWQFYLGRPAFLTPIGPDYGFRQVVIERFYSGFAQLEVTFSPALDDVLWLGMIVVAASAAWALFLNRDALRARWDTAVVLVSALLALFALLHSVAFGYVSGTGDPIITGRYLLPLSVPYGMALALSVSWLPRRLGVGLAGALLAALTLLQLGAIGITIERFYA
jgi:hypothetical protein